MKTIKRQFAIIILMFCGCSNQQGNTTLLPNKEAQKTIKENAKETNEKQIKAKDSHISLYGVWKCVVLNDKWYQKFSLKEAKTLQKSLLHIESHKMYYEGVDFVELCSYHNISEKNYDTSEYDDLALIYPKAELAKVTVVDLVDKNGEAACYNDCSILYLKQDTLINVCGGYTLFFKKISDQ